MSIDPRKGTEGFFMYYDESRVGLSCVLMHNDKITIYASKQLKTHKKNCPTHDLKLTFVLFVLKI